MDCETSQLCRLYQHEHRISSGTYATKPKLSRSVKATIADFVLNDMKPARIRNKLIDKLELTTDTVPALKQIQNFVYNYKRSKLSNTDLVEEMVEIAAGSAFWEHLCDTTAFTFGYELDDDGQPVLGDDSDENRLVIGVTTKFMLRAANRIPRNFVFHMDATFNLVLYGYPLTVSGISDSSASSTQSHFSSHHKEQMFSDKMRLNSEGSEEALCTVLKGHQHGAPSLDCISKFLGETATSAYSDIENEAADEGEQATVGTAFNFFWAVLVDPQMRML
ncbi:unnamed protein product [Phytophthora fragariaefolia]|uniref:Unnamed protein product n=1 Tax=Phytophthora fragariaefolia TaxID=1490495 RepID=A0A9W7DAE0_9STRA|nr:unnamed protein product [Phytophthora fragariaefolia]